MFCFWFVINPNYKILKSDWPSAALISALIRAERVRPKEQSFETGQTFISRAQQLPTLLVQRCWELLRPFAHSILFK